MNALSVGKEDLHAIFIEAAQLVEQSRILRDEIIATNGSHAVADHLLKHTQSLVALRDRLHDLTLTPEDYRAGALPRQPANNRVDESES